MSRMVESLKRLYSLNWITDIYLQSILNDGKIDEDEYDYIVS